VWRTTGNAWYWTNSQRMTGLRKYSDFAMFQVSDRGRVTRDYGFFLENRLRERYGLQGVPLVIDYHGREEGRRPPRRAVRSR